jgi:hypothetical protein
MENNPSLKTKIQTDLGKGGEDEEQDETRW